MKALIDNDILIKGACYGLLVELVGCVSPMDGSVGILGAARFVVPKQIRRRNLRKGVNSAIESFQDFLGRAMVLEPSDQEQKLAAELELAAQLAGLNLDAGESQLCAMLIERVVPLLLTGDKRAVQSIEQLLDFDQRLAPLSGKITCLEQLILVVLEATSSPELLRQAICAEVEVDKTLTICFSCCNGDVVAQDYSEGLRNYVTDLRQRAVRVLAP